MKALTNMSKCVVTGAKKLELSHSVPTANQMIGAWEDLRISSSAIEKSGGHHQM